MKRPFDRESLGSFCYLNCYENNIKIDQNPIYLRMLLSACINLYIDRLDLVSKIDHH